MCVYNERDFIYRFMGEGKKKKQNNYSSFKVN